MVELSFYQIGYKRFQGKNKDCSERLAFVGKTSKVEQKYVQHDYLPLNIDDIIVLCRPSSFRELHKILHKMLKGKEFLFCL